MSRRKLRTGRRCSVVLYEGAPLSSWRAGWRASPVLRRGHVPASRTLPGCTTETARRKCDRHRLSEYLARAEIVKTQPVRQFRGTHRIRQVLLVREDEKSRVSELVLVEHLVQLLLRLLNALAIVGVHDEDQSLRVLEVVSPERTDLVLTADVPHCERDVLVLHRLDVES